ncbi:hypothetical protein [Streptomyces sp. NPDC001315]|uniref:hypothetical protein n=1 Tax=Streptomyces sp. NPDC001315 TaxID=3364562 RepID=UPI0036982F3C
MRRARRTLGGALGSALAPAAGLLGGAVANPGRSGDLLGSASSVALTGTGTDALRLWSSEVGTEDHRPQLLLTSSPS